MLEHLDGRDWLALACGVFAFFAGVVAIYAAWGIDIRDSLDTVLEDEKKLAWWNGIGASLTVVSALLAILSVVIRR